MDQRLGRPASADFGRRCYRSLAVGNVLLGSRGLLAPSWWMAGQSTDSATTQPRMATRARWAVSRPTSGRPALRQTPTRSTRFQGTWATNASTTTQVGAPATMSVRASRVVSRSTSAGSGDLLFERLDERAAVMVAQPAPKLGGGELTVRLDHGPLAVHPLGLDPVQPRALARQTPDQEPAAAAGGLDPPVVGPDPGADRAADVPGGVVPDQGQDPDAVGRHPLGPPGEEGAGEGADRPPRHEAQQHPLALGQPEAVAGERLRLGVVAVGRVHAQAERLPPPPGGHGR